VAFGFKVDEVVLAVLFCWKRIMPVMEEIGFFTFFKGVVPGTKKSGSKSLRLFPFDEDIFGVDEFANKMEKKSVGYSNF
jgi:hypothetical protein